MGKPSPPETRGRFAINVLENTDNELLLLKRRQDADIGPGLWGFSAGHIENDETPGQCSRRELLEELGDDYRLELIAEFGPVRDRFYGGVYGIFLYHYMWLGGNIRLNHEHTEFHWVAKHEYRSYTVVDGIDEDIFYLGIWPARFLNQARLPGPVK